MKYEQINNFVNCGYHQGNVVPTLYLSRGCVKAVSRRFV